MGFLVKRVGLVSASFTFSLVIVTCGSGCNQPTYPHGSVIIHSTQREKYQNGQVILFGCKQGFYLDGIPIITCNGNKWTQTHFRCLGFCPELRNILNGKVSYVNPKVGEAAIEFRCANNSFRLIGNTRLECIDGRWNGKLPYCHKLPSCVRLQSPANGTLHGSDNSHSAEAKFTCFTGFDLFGAPTLTCNKGVWSSRVPTCKAYCTKIRDLPNGHVFGTRFSHGQVVSFKCKHGYELDGDRSLRCINGRWNSSVPQCKVMQCVKPSIPRNSRIIYPRTDQVRYTHGTTLYLACQQGHLLTGSPIMVCNCTTWLKREFRCIASCPILGPIKNGVITHITRKGGGEVEIKCHANYTLFGSSRLNCINGEWSSSIPSCKAPCNDPGFPENGNGQWRDLKHNSWVTFSCNEKYQLEGRKQIQCKDGVWNGNRPKCLAPCPTPIAPTNGRIQGKDFRHGRSIKFWCSRGYTRVGAFSVTCNKGRWGGPFPVCKVVQCGDPGTPTNGKQIVNKGFEYGGSVEFKCNKNYTLEGTRIIYCRANKLWSASVPHCRASCKDPGNPLNGRKDNHDFRHKKTVSFTCQKNYALEGARTVTCSNGQWSAKRPLCLALCPTPIAPTNGRIQGTDFRHGRSIKFWCSRGYTRVGAFSVTCKEGKWGAPFPVCKASCARPRIPVNGKIVGNIFSHGKSVLFYCSSGYTKVGTRSIMCDDGKWDKPFPVCKGICPTPSNPQNGKVGQKVSLDKRFLDGDEATFSCNRGYDLIGKKKLRCVGKVWDFGEPECKAVCPDPGKPLKGKRHGNNFKNGSIITFTCNTDHELIGNNTVRCEEGVWSGSVPLCKGKCKFQGSPKNGYTPNGIFPNGKLFSHGSKIEYACYATYTMDGTNILHCNDGFWNASIPSCKATCTDTGLIDRGKRNGTHFSHGQVVTYECSSKNYNLVGNPRLTCNDGLWDSAPPVCKKCVRVGAVFWGFWRTSMKADDYWKASITRITATHFDFALVNDKKLTRSYRRTDQKLIIDKVPSIGNLLPNSPVIANQFGHPGWYRSGKVIGTSGSSLVYVHFDDGEKKWVPLGRVRLLSYPDFCSDVD